MSRAVRTFGLSVAECNDLDFVIRSANSLGWLSQADDIMVTRDSGKIIVSIGRSHRRVEHSYTDESGWVYVFLRDLSQEGFAPR